jgi:DNA-binding transcriptional ArsR family regulator
MIAEPADRHLIAATANALGDDTRLRLLMLLLAAGTAGMTVTDLAGHLELAQPRISTHLAILKEVNLVDSRATGRTRVYRAVADRATPLLEAVRRAAGVESATSASPAALKATITWPAWLQSISSISSFSIDGSCAAEGRTSARSTS